MKGLAILCLALLSFWFLAGSLKCEVAEVTVVPGEVVTFNVQVTNNEEAQDVPLYSYLPTGFTGEFVYQDKIVNSVHLNHSESIELQYRLHVPKDAREGSYSVTLSALGTYSITVNVEKPENALEISSSITGAAVEAGDTVEFPVTVRNLVFGSYDVKLRCKAPKGWECKFMEGDTEVFMITLQPGETREITLSVETDSSSSTGVHVITAYFNSQELRLKVLITKTHKGEKGEVKFKVVDRDGRGVDGAKVIVGNQTFYTSPDGEATFELPAGTYDMKIVKGGYYEKELDDVKIKAGKTNDLGTVYLEKKPYYVELSVSNPRVSAIIGERPEFRFRIENRGYADDTYALSVSNLPPGFYAKFTDNSGEISEIFLESGESKDLTLQILVPPTAKPGVYNLTINAVGKAKASKNITLRLVGQYRLFFEPEGGRYLFTVDQGGELSIMAMVGNYGRGVTLTNVNISVSTPRGWIVTVTPNEILSLSPGETIPIKVRIHVPPDAIPSEYRIEFAVKSDQTQTKEEIKVIVKEKSYTTIIGIVVVVAAVLFLVYVFRKVGRR